MPITRTRLPLIALLTSPPKALSSAVRDLTKMAAMNLVSVASANLTCITLPEALQSDSDTCPSTATSLPMWALKALASLGCSTSIVSSAPASPAFEGASVLGFFCSTGSAGSVLGLGLSAPTDGTVAKAPTPSTINHESNDFLSTLNLPQSAWKYDTRER